MEITIGSMCHSITDSFILYMWGFIDAGIVHMENIIYKKHLIEHYEKKIKNKPSVGLDKISPQKFEIRR